MKVILTSKSELKINTVTRFLQQFIPFDELVCVAVENPCIPNQPVGTAIDCAKLRMAQVRSAPHDLVISIENGLDVGEKECADVCAVVARFDKYEVCGLSDIMFSVPYEYYQQARRASKKRCPLGMSQTVGQVIAGKLRVPANNWMKHPSFGNHDRSDQIYLGLKKVLCDDFLIRAMIYHDSSFKKGVVFKDLSPVLASARYRNLLQEMMNDCVRDNALFDFNKVVGLDSRGYIYGNMLTKYSFGFVMARKKGKTPGKFRSESYGTEYSTDAIEIMDDVIHHGDNVLIVDDLVATGGSLCAAKKLVESFGANVVGALVILQVDELIDHARKEFGCPIMVVLP